MLIQLLLLQEKNKEKKKRQLKKKKQKKKWKIKCNLRKLIYKICNQLRCTLIYFILYFFFKVNNQTNLTRNPKINHNSCNN